MCVIAISIDNIHSLWHIYVEYHFIVNKQGVVFTPYQDDYNINRVA